MPPGSWPVTALKQNASGSVIWSQEQGPAVTQPCLSQNSSLGWGKQLNLSQPQFLAYETGMNICMSNGYSKD